MKQNAQGYFVHGTGELLHRKIYKTEHGAIPEDWVVHHIDQVKTNNDIKNLIALPEKLHNKIHDYMRKKKVWLDRSLCEFYLNQYLEKMQLMATKVKRCKEFRKLQKKERQIKRSVGKRVAKTMKQEILSKIEAGETKNFSGKKIIPTYGYQQKAFQPFTRAPRPFQVKTILRKKVED